MEEKKKQFCILAIDDDQDDHFFIKNAVRELDFDVKLIEVYNGQQGFEVLAKCLIDAQAQMPDLIICDINMPIMNGLEFVERIAKSNSLMKIPIFILSTDCDEAIKRKVLALGVKACLSKPTYSSNYKVLIANMINHIGFSIDL